MILLIFVLKRFLINFILPKKLSDGGKKAVIDSSPTRNRLNSCIRNELPCSLRIAF